MFKQAAPPKHVQRRTRTFRASQAQSIGRSLHEGIPATDKRYLLGISSPLYRFSAFSDPDSSVCLPRCISNSGLGDSRAKPASASCPTEHTQSRLAADGQLATHNRYLQARGYRCLIDLNPTIDTVPLAGEQGHGLALNSAQESSTWAPPRTQPTSKPTSSPIERPIRPANHRL